MKAKYLLAAVAGMVLGTGVWAAPKEEAAVYPTAIFAFEERGAGVKDYGAKVADILFAKLAVNPNFVLVDRQDIKKILEEHELNLSGMVTPGQAAQVGQLTGAKVLVTGSVIEADKTLYLVAKIIGTETTRVLGESVKGKSSGDIGQMAEELAQKVGDTVLEHADKLVAKKIRMEDRIAALKEKLDDAKRPVVYIRASERHVGGQAAADPAVATELTKICKDVGFEVIAPDGSVKQADVLIEGEGFSEFAMRHGNLVSVKARLEVKAIDRNTDKVIAADRQTAVVVDLTEQIAGKAALQEAAAQIAERMLPKIVGK